MRSILVELKDEALVENATNEILGIVENWRKYQQNADIIVSADKAQKDMTQILDELEKLVTELDNCLLRLNRICQDLMVLRCMYLCHLLIKNDNQFLQVAQFTFVTLQYPSLFFQFLK